MSELHNPHLPGESFLWEGGPTAVLLAHGLTATTAEVRLLAERLRDAGYTVAGPLLAGHGATPQALNATTWHDWLWSTVQVYHELATLCDTVFVGGESTGALLALHLASTYPEVAGVLCYAPAIRLDVEPQDVLKLYLALPFRESIPKDSLDEDGRWQGYAVNPLRAVRELLRLQHAVTQRLEQITQPVLVVQGRQDTTVHPEAGDIILQGVQSAVTELHWMEHSSHVVLLGDEIDDVAALTLRFMQRALQTEAESTDAA